MLLSILWHASHIQCFIGQKLPSMYLACSIYTLASIRYHNTIPSSHLTIPSKASHYPQLTILSFKARIRAQEALRKERPRRPQKRWLGTTKTRMTKEVRLTSSLPINLLGTKDGRQTRPSNLFFGAHLNLAAIHLPAARIGTKGKGGWVGGDGMKQSKEEHWYGA